MSIDMQQVVGNLLQLHDPIEVGMGKFGLSATVGEGKINGLQKEDFSFEADIDINLGVSFKGLLTLELFHLMGEGAWTLTIQVGSFLGKTIDVSVSTLSSGGVGIAAPSGTIELVRNGTKLWLNDINLADWSPQAPSKNVDFFIAKA